MNDSEMLLKAVNIAIIRVVPNGMNLKAQIKKEILKEMKELVKKNKPIDKKIDMPDYLKSTEQMTRFLISQYAKIEDIENIGLPSEENEQIRFISSEPYNAIAFLLFMMKKFGKIDELVISYFYFGHKSIELLDSLLEKNMIGKLYFQTSKLRMYGSTERSMKYVKEIIRKYGKDRVSGTTSWVHVKIMLLKFGEKHFVIEGSGNISSQLRIEQYLIEQSKKVFEFHKDWIKNTDKFSTKKDVFIL